ncbi:hypothetical protein MRX96_009621 [Rhipicephalus microplus]
MVPDTVERTAGSDDCEMSMVNPYDSLASCSPSLEAQSWPTLSAATGCAPAGSPPSEWTSGEDAWGGSTWQELTTSAGALARRSECTEASEATLSGS